MNSIARQIPELEFSQILNEINIYGYAKIENYINPNITKILLDKINSKFEEEKNNQIKYVGTPNRDIEDKIIYGVQNLGIEFLDILSLPLVRRIAMKKLNDVHYRFLSSDKPNYILNYYNARSSGYSLDLHIDSHIPFAGQFTNMMQFSFLLEDSTQDNGCTVVVPGSHQSGDYTNRDLKKVYPIEGKPGDVIIWDSRLWHGTLKNQSNESRWALIATLSMWWVKQSMDFTRSTNQAIYDKCSNEQKLLLGFCSIPPSNFYLKTNTKTGYDHLLSKVDEYYKTDHGN